MLGGGLDGLDPALDVDDDIPVVVADIDDFVAVVADTDADGSGWELAEAGELGMVGS